jgi:hypothetical protein
MGLIGVGGRSAWVAGRRLAEYKTVVKNARDIAIRNPSTAFDTMVNAMAGVGLAVGTVRMLLPVAVAIGSGLGGSYLIHQHFTKGTKED